MFDFRKSSQSGKKDQNGRAEFLQRDASLISWHNKSTRGVQFGLIFWDSSQHQFLAKMSRELRASVNSLACHASVPCLGSWNWYLGICTLIANVQKDIRSGGWIELGGRLKQNVKLKFPGYSGEPGGNFVWNPIRGRLSPLSLSPSASHSGEWVSLNPQIPGESFIINFLLRTFKKDKGKYLAYFVSPVIFAWNFTYFRLKFDCIFSWNLTLFAWNLTIYTWSFTIFT